ncbi:MAG: hemolysin III family protein [Firmicutes bacterium]|nr:hemolysin III family protein [Bacillota bacterium]
MNNNNSVFILKDPVSSITHYIAFAAAILLTPALLIHASGKNCDNTALIGLSIFILSMILLYGASGTYHALNLKGWKAKLLKRLDHLMIFVLIAGSYTPICLSLLPRKSGFPLLISVWAFALVGMLVKFFWINCPKWFSSLIYIAMGWLCVFVFPQLWRTLSGPAFGWLLTGGILYTVGGIIYALKPRLLKNAKYWGPHEVFHVFVMMGSACHFVFMFLYI